MVRLYTGQWVAFKTRYGGGVAFSLGVHDSGHGVRWANVRGRTLVGKWASGQGQ